MVYLGNLSPEWVRMQGEGMTDEQRAERIHYHMYETNEGILEHAERIVALEELVADMWRFTGTACKKYPRLFDPAAQGGQMVQLNMIDAFEQRMRELGIEVDA